MKTIGKHLIVDLYGCSFDSLNDANFIRNAMLAAVTEAQMEIQQYTDHKFDPHGLAAVAFLTESQLSIRTYPDLGYAAIDVFSFGDQNRPDKVVQVLKRFLAPNRTKTTNIRRGDFGSVKDMKPTIKSSATPMRRVRDTSARVLKFLSRSRKQS